MTRSRIRSRRSSLSCSSASRLGRRRRRTRRRGRHQGAHLPQARPSRGLEGRARHRSVTSADERLRRARELKDAPADNAWVELPVDARGETYRFIKIEAPPHSFGSVAEVVLRRDTKTRGHRLRTQGSRDDGANTFEKCLDGDTRRSSREGPRQPVRGDRPRRGGTGRPVAVPPPPGRTRGVTVELKSETPAPRSATPSTAGSPTRTRGSTRGRSRSTSQPCWSPSPASRGWHVPSRS